jgi:predicted transcriptional regulator
MESAAVVLARRRKRVSSLLLRSAVRDPLKQVDTCDAASQRGCRDAAPGARMILASPKVSATISTGTIRESMRVMIRTPALATPSKPC